VIALTIAETIGTIAGIALAALVIVLVAAVLVAGILWVWRHWIK
jgi:hypothetical protein